MSDAIIIRPDEVKGFICSDAYISKMLLDHTNSSSNNIHINMGILKKGKDLLPATKHGEKGEGYDEVYIILKGKCKLQLETKVHNIEEGDVIFIPGGVNHGLDNKKGKDDLVLLTVWAGVPPKGINTAYDIRLEEWGRSFVRIDEDN